MVMELNQLDRGEGTICGSLQVDTKCLEANSGDWQYSMKGDISVTEKVGNSNTNVEETTCGKPCDNSTELEPILGNKEKQSKEVVKVMKEEKISEMTVELDQTVGRIDGKEQIQTSKGVKNLEETFACKEKNLMEVENDKRGLTTNREVADSKQVASTGTVKGYATPAVFEYDANVDNTKSASLKKDLVQAKGERAGLFMNGKEEHTYTNSAPGNEVQTNSKKKRKRIRVSAKKKLEKQKVLLGHGDVTSPSRMPNLDAELKKVEAQLEANGSDEVNRARKRRKKRGRAKQVNPVVAADKSNLGGKGKEVIERENTNEVRDTNSGSGIRKRRRRGRRQVQNEANDKKKRTAQHSAGKVTEKMKENSSKETMGNSTLEDAARIESTIKGKSSKGAGCNGMIFMCTSKTKEDCYRYGVFGLPSSKRDMVFKVVKGMRLFLFDVELRLLYGIYQAAGPGGYNIEPDAFKSSFPSQVRFTVLEDCLPMPEEKFKNVIKDNYYAKNKFNSELTHEQVKNLCKLFKSASKVAKLAAGGGDLVPVSNAHAKPERRTFMAQKDGKLRKDKKRSMAQDNVSRDRKRRRGQNGRSQLVNGRCAADTDSRHYYPPPFESLQYPPRHYVVDERQAYIPPTALPPIADVLNLSSYAYGLTSRVGRSGLALDYVNQELAYADARQERAVYRDPYASGRDYQVPCSSLSEVYYASLPSDEGYHRQSTPQSAADYGVPLPPYRQY